MKPFYYHNYALHCDAVPLAALADEFGTPLYVYSAHRLRANVSELQAAFAALDPLVCYSVKANNNLALLRLLRDLGLGFDVVSGGELHRAQRAGADAAQIVFAGVGKTDAELDFAVRSRVGWISVESQAELQALNVVAARLGHRQPILLRLNPDVTPDTHRHVVTGSAHSKFGMPLERVRELRAALGSHLDLHGVHVHIGSQLPGPAPVQAALEVALGFLEEGPATADTLDLGGGFPVAYHPDRAVPSFGAFAAAIAARLTHVSRPLRLLLEPGRSLVADSAALVLTVQAVKQTGATQTLIVDGGMNALIRPALYDAYHRVLPLAEVRDGAGECNSHVAGPICESADYLARDRSLPSLARGARLALLDAGAYGYSMASQYNAQPRPAEVLVDGETYRLIRRRETYADLDRLDPET